jgi:hypothetical protein
LGAPGPGDPFPVRGRLYSPYGLRFSGDGCILSVGEFVGSRVSVFRVGDGGLVEYIASAVGNPRDVEEVEGGWLVACVTSYRVALVGPGAGGSGLAQQRAGWPSLGGLGIGDGEFHTPAALAVVPGLGLVVREFGGCRLQVFATPDAIAMASMSPDRVAWMLVVARASLRPRRPEEGGGSPSRGAAEHLE